KPFKSAGTFRDGSVTNQTTVNGEGKSVGGYVTYAVKAGDIIQVKVGTSFTSVAEARRNLEAEIAGWDVNKVKNIAAAAWNKALGAVQVTDNNTENKKIFYTALYHAMLLPRVYSDVSGTYPAFAQQYKTEKTNSFEYHGDFSLWDTYRAVHPLYVLLQPERARAMVNTLISMSESGGWLPNFPCWNSYTSAMIADHGASVIADAYVKGIRGFDAEKAYQFMRKNALEPAGPEDYTDGRGRRALPSYIKYGYIPMEDSVWQAFHKREQVSRTLEYAYDDFAVAQLAKALGKQPDYQLFLKRSNNYKNIYDSQSGFMRGRHANGTWYKNINPNKKEIYITEGTPWQYTYSVQQDVPGLVNLMGGKEKFGQRLDAFFDQQQYWHGNEPSHHIAYLFNYAGTPWKTQQRINEIRTAEYGSGPGGISGNDDTGQTSAWYVFSAIGFYPVTPGTPYYIIGTPQFKEVNLPVSNNRSFRILAENLSSENIYIQSATLNRKKYNYSYLRHNDILAGGELVFKMGNKPNKDWANTIVGTLID
ncbi:MAG: GH92 family glycosyl hydrolase, partial [Adhaeribacter sp.]